MQQQSTAADSAMPGSNKNIVLSLKDSDFGAMNS
jgi:hypothetical protein